MSNDRWKDKEDVVHIYNGLLLSHRKEWDLAICNNIDGPRGYYTMWNKSDSERQILYDFTYIKNKWTTTKTGNKKIPRDKWQGKHDDPKPMGCSKSGSKREVYSDTSLPQETRKISNKQSNLTPKETRERRTNKTQS